MDSARTCLGCRLRTDRSSLLRVVERDGVVIPDSSAILPGRGGWVHPTRECVDTAIKRKAFGRALRSRVALDSAPVLHWLESQPTLLEEQAD